MGIANFIAEIDAEITKLQQARTILSKSAAPAAKKRGRPAVAVKAAAKPVKATAKPVKKKRNLSPEGRARMAAAAKARWAAVKAAARSRYRGRAGAQ
jgi:molybdopterin-guanine dinucleotide biosynthesis protein